MFSIRKEKKTASNIGFFSKTLLENNRKEDRRDYRKHKP
jgi:hypothetical protein